MRRRVSSPNILLCESILAFPQDQSTFLSWKETLAICQSVFAQVEVSPEQARGILIRQLSKLVDIAAPEHVIEKCRSRLKEAAYVTAWNDERRPENEVEFLWSANEPIAIGYLKGHRRLATRLAKRLGYTHVVID